MSLDETDEDSSLNLFDEPEGFYQPQKPPTTVSHRTLNGHELTLHLIGHSPLWGHLLWNAGRTLATYLESNTTSLVKDKTVLELGAGAGLPSLVCALYGAKQTLVTDYPDGDLISNLKHNIQQNRAILPRVGNICAEGYLWGADTNVLTACLPREEHEGFDLLILGDLLFNHSEHGKLLLTVQKTLKHSASAQALVFFTPYRPWLLEKDLAFFELARSGGFVVEKILEEIMQEAMFEDDPGDAVLRRTVFGYRLQWRQGG